MVRDTCDKTDASTRRTYLSAAGSILGATGLVSGATGTGRGTTQETDAESADTRGIDGCVTIDEPGAYELTGDLEAEADAACIVISADDVSLAGNGYTIAGDGSGTGILVDDGTAVSIENVGVENLDRGIRTVESRGTRIGAITATDAAVILDSNSASSVVRDCTLDNCDIEVVGGSQTLLLGNTVTGAAGNGIFLEATLDVSVLENTISGSETAGIYLDELSDSQIMLNEIANNGGAGIDFDEAFDNTVYLNDITNNAGAGVVLEDAENNRITDNNLRNNQGGPCAVAATSTDNIVRRNEPECDTA